MLAERQKPVCAAALRAGALAVEDGTVKPVGDVRLFGA